MYLVVGCTLKTNHISTHCMHCALTTQNTSRSSKHKFGKLIYPSVFQFKGCEWVCGESRKTTTTSCSREEISRNKKKNRRNHLECLNESSFGITFPVSDSIYRSELLLFEPLAVGLLQSKGNENLK